jgi:cytochrome c peroxidase
VTEDRQAVARGEVLFDTTPIAITGVSGLNDVLRVTTIEGFCGTCHDSPNVGNHSVKAPLNIGIANAGANSPPALSISGLPVFTLQCVSGPLAGTTYTVTDPGRALISGKCADIGKVKGPILRGLAARAPYFHNGSAATLLERGQLLRPALLDRIHRAGQTRPRCFPAHALAGIPPRSA